MNSDGEYDLVEWGIKTVAASPIILGALLPAGFTWEYMNLLDLHIGIIILGTGLALLTTVFIAWIFAVILPTGLLMVVGFLSYAAIGYGLVGDQTWSIVATSQTWSIVASLVTGVVSLPIVATISKAVKVSAEHQVEPESNTPKKAGTDQERKDDNEAEYEEELEEDEYLDEDEEYELNKEIVDALDRLGLDDGVDSQQIQRQYKMLLKRFHPDHNGGDRSLEKMLQRTIEAYEVLKRRGLLSNIQN